MTACVVTNEAEACLPLHRHEDARIIVVLEGEVHESDLSGKRVFRKGEILFRPPFCAHANAPSGARSSFLRLPVSRKYWLDYVRRHGWRGMRGRLDFKSRDQRALLHAKSGGDGVLSLLVDGDSPDGNWEEASVARYSSLHALAASNGLEPYQLTRRFQQRYGLTPSAWRREWRLRRALALLAEGCVLAEIAVECGFSDQSHLSREVKRATGMAPAAFQRFACD